jgi:arylsulfatase A-like enzyme
LLVTTDSLSFSHTTLGGYRRDTTPRLASWARRATVFPTAFSLSAATRTGFPGLIAGIFNAQAELRPDRTPPFPYAETMATTAALLRAQGYRTVHIPGDRFFLENGRGWHTVGFEVVDDACIRAGDPIHTAPEITAAAIRHIDAQPAGQPLFLWVHYFDHHIPFQLGPGIEPFDEQRGKVDRYDAEIRFADAHWGRLLEHVERVWEPDRYLAIFTGDHGESFDANHPDKHHSGSILTSVLHVPLVIQAAERRGHTVAGLVSHADILPTIANVLGLEPDRRWVGSSLAAVLFAGAEVERDVLYSLRFAPELYQRQGAGFLEIGVRTSRHYLIHDLELGAARLVDWRNDPLERDDRSAAEPAEYARLRHLARRKLAWLEARACGLKYPACP